MNARSLATSFLAAVLLLGALGCSKQEGAAPATSTARFLLDGLPVSCRATATRGASSLNGTVYDFLYLDLTPDRPTGGIGQLRLSLYKVPGSSASTYALLNLMVYTADKGSPYYLEGTALALTAAGADSYSGTFAGMASGAAPGPYTALTNGVFTKVRF